MPCEVTEKLKAKIMETRRRICAFWLSQQSLCQVGISTLMRIDKEREAVGGKWLAQSYTQQRYGLHFVHVQSLQSHTTLCDVFIFLLQTYISFIVTLQTVKVRVMVSVMSDSVTHELYEACQAPLSMEFSRHEYWSGQTFFSPGDLPVPGIEPRSPAFDNIHVWRFLKKLEIELPYDPSVYIVS